LFSPTLLEPKSLIVQNRNLFVVGQESHGMGGKQAEEERERERERERGREGGKKII
jgi:hypothetical protein